MRRQFLRVYIGIALVLLIAALATLFIVDREMRTLIERRMEETMAPWIERVRARLTRAGADEELRAQALERLNNFTPFDLRLAPLAELKLSTSQKERLKAGETVLATSDEERMVYALLDDDEVIVLGPLRGRMFSPGRWGLRKGQPLHPEGPQRLGRDGPRPWRLPLQGAYFLLGALLAILLLIGAAVYLLLRPFERRIYALADVARNFGEGQFDSRAKADRDDAIGALSRTFNDMADRIGSFIERQKELLRAVSHEFRTPLARLFFLVDDAQGTAAPEEKDQLLGRIEGSLQDLNDLVEELLTFVRLEGDAEQPARETVDIATVLADVSAVVSDLRGDLELTVDGGDLEIAAVPRLFKRAVLNLATNAARHARQRIEISCVRQEGTLELYVDDDGPGIPVNSRERVFDPFFRLDESRTADSGGSGLGLAIVQRIAAVHGGQVRVEESPLGGARFTLSFPVA